MKGTNLQKQFNKMIKNHHNHEACFYVVLQVQETYNHPDNSCELTILQPIVSGYDWELVINDIDKFNECTKNLPKDLKCKYCNKCGLKTRGKNDFISCHEIQRLEF